MLDTSASIVLIFIIGLVIWIVLLIRENRNDRKQPVLRKQNRAFS